MVAFNGPRNTPNPHSYPVDTSALTLNISITIMYMIEPDLTSKEGKKNIFVCSKQTISVPPASPASYEHQQNAIS